MMPPKARKPNLLTGQKKLSLNLSLRPTSMTEPSLPYVWNMFDVSSSRRGTVGSWRAFVAANN